MIKMVQRLRLSCQIAEQSNIENVRKNRKPWVNGNILYTGVKLNSVTCSLSALCLFTYLSQFILEKLSVMNPGSYIHQIWLNVQEISA